MKTTQGIDVDLFVTGGLVAVIIYLLHLVAVSYFTVFPLFFKISNLLTVLNFEEATLMMTTCTHHQVSL